MAKRSGKNPPRASGIADFFDPRTKVEEPLLSEQERAHFDELGVIGAAELTSKGFYASIVRGKPSPPRTAAARTTILVVEDDAGTAAVIERVLAAAGYATRRAANRAQFAEEVCRTPPPDLILLDVVLPEGLNGFHVLNRIRQHPVLANVPVIMVTSLGGQQDIAKGLSLGADGYLTKPARPSVLVDAVRAVLSG